MYSIAEFYLVQRELLGCSVDPDTFVGFGVWHHLRYHVRSGRYYHSVRRDLSRQRLSKLSDSTSEPLVCTSSASVFAYSLANLLISAMT